jgi:glutathione S-transferase
MITITAYDWVPDAARGKVRDLQVRWALEEAGLDYRVQAIDHRYKSTPEYKTWQPFGQVPAYDDGTVRLFESGAIVLHIAENSAALLPADPAARARAKAWAIAALNSIDPFVLWLAVVDVFQSGEAWSKPARPYAAAAVQKRLDDLARWLDGRTWLEDRFSAGDLLMASALRGLARTDMVSGNTVLGPYLERCLARPAFVRALAGQLADFTGVPADNFGSGR